MGRAAQAEQPASAKCRRLKLTGLDLVRSFGWPRLAWRREGRAGAGWTASERASDEGGNRAKRGGAAGSQRSRQAARPSVLGSVRCAWENKSLHQEPILFSFTLSVSVTLFHPARALPSMTKPVPSPETNPFDAISQPRDTPMLPSQAKACPSLSHLPH